MSLLDHLRTKLRRNLRSRSFFPQLHGELEHQALGPKDPSPQPQGPSLLMLRALQELDLTACSKLTDASLAKVWNWGWRCGQTEDPGIRARPRPPHSLLIKSSIGFCYFWLGMGAPGRALGSSALSYPPTSHLYPCRCSSSLS